MGSLVFFSGFMTWTANNFTASSGPLQLEGLPYAAASDNLYRGGASFNYTNSPWANETVYMQALRSEAAETNMIINFNNTTAGSISDTIDTHSNVNSTGDLMITGTYSVL